MKSRVEKTHPPSCCPAEKAFHTEVTKGTEVFSLVPKLYLGMLLLLVLVCFVQFSSSAKASPAFASPGKSPGYALAFTGAKKGRRLTRQHRNVLPDSPKDLGESNNSLDDARAEFSARPDPVLSSFILPPSSFSLKRSFRTVPAFLLPTHSSDSLHEQIRERAPPALA